MLITISLMIDTTPSVFLCRFKIIYTYKSIVIVTFDEILSLSALNSQGIIYIKKIINVALNFNRHMYEEQKFSSSTIFIYMHTQNPQSL